MLLSEEDEWSGLQQRFTAEGLDWCGVSASNRVLHLWRWLLDAEDNLQAARHISDKLRIQHQEEKNDAEQYAAMLHNRSMERVRQVEVEGNSLKEQLQDVMAAGAAVTAMLQQEGLEDVATASLGEQIAYLLVERSRLVAEGKSGAAGPHREHHLTTQLIKTSTELELVRRSVSSAKEAREALEQRIAVLEKAAHQLQIDNDSLAFKVSEAYAEMEEKEVELREAKRARDVVPSPGYPQSPECAHPPNSLPPMLAVHSGSPADQYSPPLSVRICKRDHDGACRGRTARRSSSLHRPAADTADRDSEQHLEEVAELKAESSALRSRLLTAEDRLEAALRNLERYRIKSRSRLQAMRLRGEHEAQQQHARAGELTSKATALETVYAAQKSLCSSLEAEMAVLRQERQEIQDRILDREKMCAESVSKKELMEHKNTLLTETNCRLSHKVKELTLKDTIISLAEPVA